MPSVGPGTNPRSVRRCWRCCTSSPATPLVRVRSSTVFVTGAVVSIVAITSGTESGTVSASAVADHAVGRPAIGADRRLPVRLRVRHPRRRPWRALRPRRTAGSHLRNGAASGRGDGSFTSVTATDAEPRVDRSNRSETSSVADGDVALRARDDHCFARRCSSTRSRQSRRRSVRSRRGRRAARAFLAESSVITPVSSASTRRESAGSSRHRTAASRSRVGSPGSRARRR